MADNNVKEAYAMINGVKTSATYDPDTQLWTVNATAPAASSWSRPGHVYEITLHAEDLAGNKVEMTSADETYGAQLKLRVLEKSLPTATIEYPTTNSVLGKSTVEIKLHIQDAGGSCLNLSEVKFKIDESDVPIEAWYTAYDEGDSISGDSVSEAFAKYSKTGLSDGIHTLTLTVKDNDGNEATLNTVTFTISTAAPKLDITSPIENFITNSKTVTVSGTATAGNEYVSITEVTVNGDAVDPLEESGTFSKDVTFEEDGEQTITIIAKDSAGNTVTVARKITIDTKAPIITEVHTENVTVDASGKVKITFKVVEQ